MRKNAKRASKSTQAKKANVKDLAVKNPSAVKGGKVALQDISIPRDVDKGTSTL